MGRAGCVSGSETVVGDADKMYQLFAAYVGS